MAEREFTLNIQGPEDFEVSFSIPVGITHIGRQSDSDLTLAHTQVSRLHARLDATADSCEITDLGSSNATYVNDEKLIPNAPAGLKNNDRIKIGPFQVQVKVQLATAEDTRAHKRPVIDPSVVSEVVPAPEGPVEDKAARAEPQQEVDSPSLSAAPPPPPPSTQPPVISPPSAKGYPAPFPGLTLHSQKLIHYLPGIYHSDFMTRFLGIFEATLLPIEWNIDHFDQFLTPDTSPSGFLPWLSSWYGLTFDSTWTEEMRRTMTREAHKIYARRGTRWALGRVLSIYTGFEPEIDDQAEDLDPFTFSIVIPLRKRDVRSDLIEALIDAHKPAHTTYTLKYRG